MKKLLIFILILTAALPAAAGSTKQDRQLEEYKNYKKAYGIAYDSKRDRILVSNIGTYGRVYPLSENLNEDDGYITIRGEYNRPDSLSSGELVLPNVVLNSPAGLQIVNEDTLYICDYNLNQIVIYDLENDSVLNRVYIDTSVYQGLNNICYDNNGSLYLTNVQYTRFYKYEIATGTISEPVLSGETVENPIDMYFDEDNNRIILVSCTDSSYIQAIDLSTFNVTNVYPDKFRGLTSITEDNTGHYYIMSVEKQNQSILYKIDTAFSNTPIVYEKFNYNAGKLYYDKEDDYLFMTNLIGGLLGYAIFNYPVNLIYPENGATNVESDVELLWNFENNANEYEIELALDSAFENIVLDTTILYRGSNIQYKVKDTSLTVDDLLPGTTYYWRIQSIGTWFKSPTRDIFSFTVATTAKTAPTIIFPTADTVLIYPDCTFQWASMPNADAYIIQIFQEYYNIGMLYEAKTTSTTFSIEDFALGGDFSWRVKATNGSGGSPWSASTTFSFEEPTLYTPLIWEPSPNTNVPSSGTIVWWNSEGATNYKLEIGIMDRATDQYITKNEYFVEDTLYNYEDLELGETYDVRVRAISDTGVSASSILILFMADTVITPPGVIDVEGDNEDVSLLPRLSWTETQANYYEIEVYREDVIAGRKSIMEVLEEEKSGLIIILKKQVENNFYIIDEELDKNTVYRWRVRAVTDRAYSSWSNSKAFTTGDGSNSTGGDTGGNSNIVKVYPNPVENTALIIVNWPDSSDGTVTIYDNMGNKLTTLFSGRPETKVSVLDWDASSVGSGTYYIHVVCGETTGTRKMIISK